MKRYLKYISLSLLSGSLFLTSCEDEDAPFEDPTNIGGYAYLEDQTISVFDTNEDLNIKLFTDEGVTVNTVEVTKEGSVLTTADISDESATINSSVLGNFADGDSFDVWIESQLSNGNTARDPFTISVVKAIEADSENSVELSLDSLANGASIDYNTYTLSAPIDDASLFLKKNSDGTYVESEAEVSVEGGTIDFTDTNYDELNLAVQDTLYYEFRATSGSMTQTDESFITIIE